MKAFSVRSLLVTVALALFVAAGLAQDVTFPNVAADKPVAASRAPAEAYPDPDGLKLTDGSYAFAWGDMVGFEGSAPVTLTVDLGETYDYLSLVSLKVMRSDGSAVNVPANFIVSVSEDGVLYEDLGMATGFAEGEVPNDTVGDRKSTRLNSSHVKISYAVFCLKKKTKEYFSISNTAHSKSY